MNSNKEQTMYYGMFTDAGNMAVHTIATIAKDMKLSWADTYQALRNLAESNPEQYGEATDTVVREIVYDTIGSDEPFYI
jgi:phosphatidylserine decarboxylase